MIFKAQSILGILTLYALLINCDDGPGFFSNADAGCTPPIVPPVARCGVWEPSQEEAFQESLACHPPSARGLPAVQKVADASRVIGMTVAYAPGQEVSKRSIDEMLNFNPFCVNPPQNGGVPCQLHFKLNGKPKLMNEVSPRGRCLPQGLINAAADVIGDQDAADLLGLDPAGNYSADGPVANVLFVNNLQLSGMPGTGIRCGPNDIACGVHKAGGILIEKQNARPSTLKHEIGHLHNLQHAQVAGVYVSDIPQPELAISASRCTYMRTHKPQNYSPWFEALGGTVTTEQPDCVP